MIFTSGAGHDNLPDGTTVKGTPMIALDRLRERYAEKGVLSLSPPQRCRTSEHKLRAEGTLEPRCWRAYGPLEPGRTGKVHRGDSLHEFSGRVLCKPVARDVRKMGAFCLRSDRKPSTWTSWRTLRMRLTWDATTCWSMCPPRRSSDRAISRRTIKLIGGPWSSA